MHICKSLVQIHDIYLLKIFPFMTHHLHILNINLAVIYIIKKVNDTVYEKD